jgi:16S rRNA (guanine527-N7)-methyltransferase
VGSAPWFTTCCLEAPILTPDSIAELLKPYTYLPIGHVVGASASEAGWPEIYSKLVIYLELILKWNARINLTAIRTPEEIVRRHFGESLFVGAHLGACGTLLDFGSGAGFPGVPIQLLRPEVQVTLAESQGKKAAFLREVVRSLELPTEVWAGRVEAMPAARRFDAVTMRAVDEMDRAMSEAGPRAREQVLIVGTARKSNCSWLAVDFRMAEPVPLPSTNEGALWIANRC